MASERLIKRRIKSAGNIAKITKAMQMMAASKMKKAQNLALSGRPYAQKIAEMVSTFVAKIDADKHALLKINEKGKTLIVLISTNKGLCGGFNANLTRSIVKWFKEEDLKNFVFVTMGKRGENFLVRNQRTLIADFSDNLPYSKHIGSVTKYIVDGYIKGEFKEVYLVYNNFISALQQDPTNKKILPMSEFNLSGNEADKTKPLEFIVEPKIETILDSLLINYLENQVRDAIMESAASEHSARMIAMKNATDNALELMDLLTLEYNKARQEKITYEIAEIVPARLAVE